MGGAIVEQPRHMLHGFLGSPGSGRSCCCGLVPPSCLAASSTLLLLLQLRLLLHQCHLPPGLEVKHPDAALPAGHSWPAVAGSGSQTGSGLAPLAAPPVLLPP